MAPQVLPPLAQPGPEDVHVARGILGTVRVIVYAPGTDVPLIDAEIDPRIMADDFAERCWQYVVEKCPQGEPEPPKPALELVK